MMSIQTGNIRKVGIKFYRILSFLVELFCIHQKRSLQKRKTNPKANLKQRKTHSKKEKKITGKTGLSFKDNPV